MIFPRYYFWMYFLAFVFTVRFADSATVTTLSASGFGPGASTLNAAATLSAGSANFGYFEYGLTTNYGSETGQQLLGSSSANVNFNQPLTGLASNQIYHFRADLIIVNAGNFYGNDMTFTIPAATNRNLGVDASHYQGSSGIPETNWAQMYATADRFAFVKATEGLTGPDDPTMATNVANAMAAGLVVGVYHYAHPENRPTTNGAVMEADHFLSYTGSAIGPGMLRPVLDLETGNGVLTPSQMSAWVLAFSQEVVSNRGKGAAPIVYCTQSYANSNFDSRVAGNSLWITAGGGDPLTSGPSTNGYSSPTGVFANWAFWQYNTSGSAGGISPIDVDVCHEEFAPLSSYLIPIPAGGFKVGGLMLDQGGFHLSFTNVPGTHFTLLSSTNASLSLSDWVVTAMASEVSPGQFQITDSGATNLPGRFYRVHSP